MKKIITNIILVIAIICFLGSAGYLGKYYYDGYISQKNIKALEAYIQQPETDAADESSESTLSPAQQMMEKYGALYEQNSDFAGWLTIPDTVIDYPVMQSKDDPEFYLHRNFDKNYDYSGLLFIDAGALLDPQSTNVTIYGHNMNNRTMFQPLTKYLDFSFYEEHKYIQFDTLSGPGTYEIVAVITAPTLTASGFRYYGLIDTNNEKVFNNHMDNIHSLEIYDTGVDAQFGDHLLTLSTCDNISDNGRLAVIARKIN